MQPWYWVGTYSIGIAFGFVFDQFLKNRNSAELTGSTKILTNLSKNWKPRAFMYTVSVLLIASAFYRSQRYIVSKEGNSQSNNAFWATFGGAGIGTACGFLTLIMLVGKLSWLRSILAADMWLPLSSLMPTFSILSPITCLWFFLSTSAPLNYTFMSQVFYYCGNIAFLMIFVLLVAPISDLPTQTLNKMPYNLLLVRVGDSLSSLKQVMAPVTFKVQNASTLLSSEVIEEGEEDIDVLKNTNKVTYQAPDFGRDSTMVSQADRPTIAPRFTTQGGDMFGRMTE